MLNAGLRREAVEKLEKAVKRHETLRNQVQKDSVKLFEQRQRAASEVVEAVEMYVNALANSPKEFDKSVARYRVETNRFDDTVRQIEIEAAHATQVGGATGAAGAAAGLGVAAFGPTAALAIATTFGTASTGTAIGALSGAAATNAALAWLGGGALVAGGGGMAGGNALLALAGPVGWAIGGVALTGSAVFLHMRNATLAEQATKESVKVEAEVGSMRTAQREITGLAKQTKTHSDGCLGDLAVLRKNAPSDYSRFDKASKERLGAVINHIRSLGKLLKAEVAL